MLVLSRKTGETIKIGHKVTITVLQTRSNNVRLGIQAPSRRSVLRGELRPNRTRRGK